MPMPHTYFTRLRWLIGAYTLDTDNGQQVLTHSDNGYLWANVEELGGRREEELGAVQTGVDATVRIRNYPTVRTIDLLEDEALGYVWRIQTIHNGDDEIICDCFRWDELVMHTEEGGS